MKSGASWIGLIVGLAALILQLILTIPTRLETGDNIFGAVIFYFTFFTILTNLALVLIYVSELWPQEGLSWFRTPVTRGMMVAAIVLVGLFYHFVLAATWDPQGLWKVADVVLHYVTPIFYVLWWVLFMRHGRLKFGEIPAMLLPPVIYLIYAMIRGAILSEYPYPILEANRIGYGVVAINIAYLLVGVALLCSIVVAIDRALTRVDMPGP
ncbi:MAG: Pr6Pr family membrane protein [Devosia sp.]